MELLKYIAVGWAVGMCIGGHIAVAVLAIEWWAARTRHFCLHHPLKG